VGGVIPLWGKPAHIQLDDFLWAGADAKFASFTVLVRYFNPTFCGHSLLLDEKLDKN
jgi:hypothetical protein